MYTIVYFSPTGNTKFLAQHLSEHLSVKHIYALEDTDPKTLETTPHLVLLFAIHAFNAPKPVLQFVKSFATQQFSTISLIAVGCSEAWINHGATYEIKQILHRKHCQILVDKVIAMPSNMLIAYSDAQSQSLIVAAKQTIQNVVKDIMNNHATYKKIPLRARVISKIGKLETIGARFFGLELFATKKCNQCGICVRSCPQKNIKLQNDKIRFEFKCIMCLRCIYTCPQAAITPRFSKFIPIKGGYSLKRYLDE